MIARTDGLGTVVRQLGVNSASVRDIINRLDTYEELLSGRVTENIIRGKGKQRGREEEKGRGRTRLLSDWLTD